MGLEWAGRDELMCMWGEGWGGVGKGKGGRDFFLGMGMARDWCMCC